MVTWFRETKARHGEMHCAWAYRDRADQELAFVQRKSNAHYPFGPHNRVNSITQEPESKALDIFQIDPSGKAIFDPMFCAKINAENEAAGVPIQWGGKFTKLGDYDHFQLADT